MQWIQWFGPQNKCYFQINQKVQSNERTTIFQDGCQNIAIFQDGCKNVSIFQDGCQNLSIFQDGRQNLSILMAAKIWILF
jgi:hypothetical protein